ncbi:MAG: prephenate dehydratase [Flavobacteriales bacterium]|jgi:prephenate dehydratase|nr:prephenate dehydratase [Flavobacteriaceae bacterium]MDO7592262.1 prephenate dehydratase [Flavobacteriaceae bacterium]MDO7599114.1 prephenate dehydratase [Flavobacteriaceae bacterium]MDO7603760.1 prephenate dehydratase [Flavobacteriaceae bacterium]MDO7615515.1 prephenate dehydratase [Flavobacteriaceae bacterium]|tara:strand:+ start:2235 stop:3062 length:828 start_codon:yes stop_codon:yes gene_type:complete
MQSIIAIQGIQGSFHHQVALNYFPSDIQISECLTFDALADALVSGRATQAVMAIENSIAGSIIPNYALLDKHNLQIIGESYLNIEHNLMGLQGQSIADLKEVHSHPMALLQCKSFFSEHSHIRLVEAEDTADIARKIEEDQLHGIGAVASTKAANIFNLEVFSESIQTIKNNVTRFVIVQKKGALVEEKNINKAALKFVLDHQRGSLAAVLNVMSDCQLNLTKIQSLPVIETPGKYAFFVDVTFDAIEHYKKARSIIEIMATEFKILGEYPKNKL